MSSADPGALLQELAHNDIAGFAVVGSHVQSIESNGLSNSYEDLEDPAALLESLASFHRPTSSDENHTVGSNGFFESLLQAAATAGEEAARANDTTLSEIARRSVPQDYFKRSFDPELQIPKHGRDDVGGERRNGHSPSKRQKSNPAREEQEREAREDGIWGADDHERGDQLVPIQYPSISYSELKAAGIHSAAALFRGPTVNAKKYSRPQMAKVFTSLEIDPEAFIHLQAAAKTYMLDDAHPERRDCIGIKGTKDTDLIKLKLFSCVQSFLDDEGWGETIFGANAESSVENRKLIWPQMSNKIITLVTPLLRRMVTNERQRQYALETRTERRKGGKRRDRATHSHTPCSSPGGNRDSQVPSSPSPSNDLDPKLDEDHDKLKSGCPPEDGGTNTIQQNDNAQAIDSTEEHDDTRLTYHLNILSNNRRLIPKIYLNPANCPGFPSLVQHAQNALDDDERRLVSVKILGPAGLVEVKDEDSWREVLESIKKEEWMDGEVKCVAEVEDEF